MNIDEKQLRFFYAQEVAAGMYDRTVDLVVPLYVHLHEMLISIAKDHLLRYRNLLSKPIGVLDIGFGTGTESFGLVRAVPDCTILGIDLCGSMLEAFKRKTVTEVLSEHSFDLLEGDFTDDTDLSVGRIIATGATRKPFSVVMTAFTFHHFTLEKKLAAYRKVYDLLAPGGIFVNGDLFNFSPRFPDEWQDRKSEFAVLPDSKCLTEQAHRFDIAYIEQSFQAEISRPEYERRSRLSIDELKKLRARWVHHYQTFNILDSAETQTAMLKQIGFAETGIPFRYWQVGLIYGRKPA